MEAPRRAALPDDGNEMPVPSARSADAAAPSAMDHVFGEPSEVAELDDDYEDEPETRRERGQRQHRHGPAWAVLWLAFALAVVACLGYFGYTKGLSWVRSFSASSADYAGPGDADVTVTIPDGSVPSSWASILLNADVVASTKAFTNAANSNPDLVAKVFPGNHNLKTKMSGVQALTALADPTLLVKQQFTVTDGLRDTQVFDVINQKTGVPVADLQALATNAGPLGLPSWAGTTNAEGYLYPDTYQYPNNPTAQDVLAPMVTQFTKVTDSLDFAAKAQANGLTPAQAVVLASIIEKEGSNPTYASDIAQVFYNRLKAGMPLQSDATVLYACNVTGSLTTTDDERNNAPAANCPDPAYNTYVNTGLPPGPISNPGQDALTAAVNPTSGTYLYFVVTDPSTGTVAFASTMAQHQANVAQFQAWCQANPGKC